MKKLFAFLLLIPVVNFAQVQHKQIIPYSLQDVTASGNTSDNAISITGNDNLSVNDSAVTISWNPSLKSGFISSSRTGIGTFPLTIESSSLTLSALSGSGGMVTVNGQGQLSTQAIPSAQNLSLGTITGTTIPLNISGGGTGVTLPSATQTLAGLLTASDKVKIDSSVSQSYVDSRIYPSFLTTSSNNTDANNYTKVASFKINSQNWAESYVIDITRGHGGSSNQHCYLLFRVLQTSPFGNNPLIEARMYTDRDLSANYKFWYVITQNTNPSTVEIYAQPVSNFCQLAGIVINADHTGNNTINFYNNQPYLTSLPSGTGNGQFIQYILATQDWVTSQIPIPQNLSLGTSSSTTLAINISNGTGITLPSATTSMAGLLSSTDKSKLDGLNNANLGNSDLTITNGTSIRKLNGNNAILVQDSLQGFITGSKALSDMIANPFGGFYIAGISSVIGSDTLWNAGITGGNAQISVGQSNSAPFDNMLIQRYVPSNGSTNTIVFDLDSIATGFTNLIWPTSSGKLALTSDILNIGNSNQTLISNRTLSGGSSNYDLTLNNLGNISIATTTNAQKDVTISSSRDLNINWLGTADFSTIGGGPFHVSSPSGILLESNYMALNGSGGANFPTFSSGYEVLVRNKSTGQIGSIPSSSTLGIPTLTNNDPTLWTSTLLSNSTDKFGAIRVIAGGSSGSCWSVTITYSQPFSTIAIPVISTKEDCSGGGATTRSDPVISAYDVNGFTITANDIDAGETIEFLYHVDGY